MLSSSGAVWAPWWIRVWCWRPRRIRGTVLVKGEEEGLGESVGVVQVGNLCPSAKNRHHVQE